MAYSEKIREEELKNKVGIDFFSAFDWSQIRGGIDFAVAPKSGTTRKLWDDVEFFLWAEAKAGKKKKIQESFVQLIFTIGKERTHEKLLPPAFLGAFDAEKIAFVPYLSVAEVFSQTDFNWNVAPSNHNTKEFKQLSKLVADTLKDESTLFYFGKDDRELKDFIKKNFREGVKEPGKIQITKNNFISIYQKWHSAVAPHIAIDWKETKKAGLLDADFYLADLLSQDNFTLKEKLRVLLKSDHYKLVKGRGDFGFLDYSDVNFKDKARAHRSFWKRYVRPPKKEYWEFITDRRDLLVPQDVRERKGSYYTPQIWVEKSQEYLADALGENWQDEYVVWDCCAGTGNMLNGLANVYNVFASTLDPSDVQIMKDRAANGANLLEEHIFQFDFLNDDLLDDESTGEESKLPKALQDIIRDPEKRKKLVIYINPPYAEATSATTVTGTGENKDKVATAHAIHGKYKKDIKKASNELFALFFTRIYKEIPGAVLAEFSTLKALQSSNFSDFRNMFKAKLRRLFLVPANTFDNVKGQFPIGFFIWNTAEQKVFEKITADVYDRNGDYIGEKTLYSPKETPSINIWIKTFDNKEAQQIAGYMENPTPDFQNNKFLCVINDEGTRHNNYYAFYAQNFIPGCVYLAVRLCIDSTWLNDRDQFLFPKDSWQNDTEFHSDCLAFTLFHGQNKISIEEGGVNNWIPFTEKEVGARKRFSNHFMSDFLAGKLSKKKMKDAPLFQLYDFYDGTTPVKFSKEARAVFDAGRELWKYYHSEYGAAVDASLYDIKMHFQGVNDKGRMNPKSDDGHYMELITELRERLKILAKKIELKVYEHGFLLK